jgi:hypothetical protein
VPKEGPVQCRRQQAKIAWKLLVSTKPGSGAWLPVPLQAVRDSISEQKAKLGKRLSRAERKEQRRRERRLETSASEGGLEGQLSDGEEEEEESEVVMEALAAEGHEAGGADAGKALLLALLLLLLLLLLLPPLLLGPLLGPPGLDQAEPAVSPCSISTGLVARQKSCRKSPWQYRPSCGAPSAVCPPLSDVPEACRRWGRGSLTCFHAWPHARCVCRAGARGDHAAAAPRGSGSAGGGAEHRRHAGGGAGEGAWAGMWWVLQVGAGLQMRRCGWRYCMS